MEEPKSTGSQVLDTDFERVGCKEEKDTRREHALVWSLTDHCNNRSTMNYSCRRHAFRQMQAENGDDFPYSELKVTRQGYVFKHYMMCTDEEGGDWPVMVPVLVLGVRLSADWDELFELTRTKRCVPIPISLDDIARFLLTQDPCGIVYQRGCYLLKECLRQWDDVADNYYWLVRAILRNKVIEKLLASLCGVGNTTKRERVKQGWNSFMNGLFRRFKGNERKRMQFYADCSEEWLSMAISYQLRLRRN